jgi:hypothetical protein
MLIELNTHKAGRWFLAIVLLSLFAAEVSAANHGLNHPKATVNFRTTTDGLILVDASFGKGGIHTFLIDSGISYPGMLERTIADEAELKKEKKIKTLVHIENSSGTVIDTKDWREATIVQKNGIKVILVKGALPTIDFPAFSKYIGSPIAGFIGSAVFSRYVVEIDYATDKLSFFEPRKFQYSGTSQIFPLEDHGNLLVIDAQIELADCTLVPVHLYLDSGDNADLTLNPHFVQTHPNLGNRKFDPRSFGLGGTLNGSWGDIHSLTIGGYSVPAPDTVLLHSDSTKTEDSLTDGSLGSEVFSMFTIFVDRPDGKIIFEPRTDKPLTPVKPCVPSSTSDTQPTGQPKILSSPPTRQKSPNPL